MDIGASLKMAKQSLMANKMRSFLTMLGVIIGVAAVLIMVAMGQGTASGITARISSMGANLLTVTAGGNSGPIRGTNSAQLTNADAEALKGLPLVQNVAAESSTSGTIAWGNTTWSTTVDGTWPQLMSIKDWQMVQGSFFSAEDDSNACRVAVLGNTVVDNLFPRGETAVGKTIKINGISFTVIGVLEEKGSSSGSDQDDIIYIPLRTLQQRMTGGDSVRSISVQAAGPEALSPLKTNLASLLRQRHRLSETADDDFSIRDTSELLATIEDTTRMLSLLLGGIAGVSLLVGGIGIMNIMLVSVTERTREIGIRMAIGATTGAIRTQFLIESLLLCLIGGFLGILLGWGGGMLIANLADLNMQIAPWLVVLSLGFATVIGLFFGYYPADKAAHMNPIDALRFE